MTFPLGLVVLEPLCAHVLRALRVLRLPRGHQLLLGPEGSGRRTVARLAAHLAGFLRIEPPTAGPVGITRSEWEDTLRTAVLKAAFGDKPVVLVVQVPPTI